jgi:Na+/H+ antiporter NhaC
MGSIDLIKPSKSKLVAFLVLLIIFELSFFFLGFNAMVTCICPESAANCDCSLSADERINSGLEAVIAITTHVIFIPILLFLYLGSCFIVEIINKFRK